MTFPLMLLFLATVAAMSLALAFGPGDREDAEAEHTYPAGVAEEVRS